MEHQFYICENGQQFVLLRKIYEIQFITLSL